MFRLLLEHLADVNAKDKINCTALHYASYNGNVDIVSMLLEEDADPNAVGDFLVTPLHIATSPKVVQILLRCKSSSNQKDVIEKLCNRMVDDLHKTCGGAKNHPCICSEFGDLIPKVKQPRKRPTGESQKGMTCFQNLMNREPNISETVLDECITTNEERLDSSNLVVTYNFGVFKEVDERMKERGEKHGAVKSSIEMIENNPDLLGHPLYHALIESQWSSIKKIVILFALLMTAFVVFISRLVWIQTNQLQEYKRGTNTNTSNICWQNDNNSEHISFAYRTYCLPSNHFLVFYILSWLMLLTIVAREVLQWIARGLDYVGNLTNWGDWLLIITSTVYLTLFATSANASVLQQSAAFTIFVVWMSFVGFLGRLPVLGIYVNMYFSVAHTLCFFILLFSPIFTAFALSLHALVLENPIFRKFRHSILKSIVMGIGELEFESNFFTKHKLSDGTEEIDESSIAIATQLVVALFLFLGTIALMNLLVGLAVDEIGNLRKRAKLVQLEKNTEEIIFLEYFKDIMSDYFKNQNDGLIQICIKPNHVEHPKIRGEFRKWTSSGLRKLFQILSNTPRTRWYPVYEQKAGQTMENLVKTGFSFPQDLVDETLIMLRKKLDQTKE